MTTKHRGLGFVEKLAYGPVLTISLMVALTWSPLWQHLPDITLLLPPQYAGTIEVLPGTPNTGLAFFITLGLTYAALFLLREPTGALGALTALVLGTAAYPYGNIKWHLLFATTPFDEGEPTIGAWFRGIIPVLLLLIPPVVTHSRNILHAYAEKGVTPGERALVRHHLLRGAFLATGIALAASILIGSLLRVGGRLLASETRILGRNSALVMLVVALLLVFALGLGTGLFDRPDTSEDEGEATPEEART